MIRNPQPGDRVVVLGVAGKPLTTGRKAYRIGGGPWRTWDYARGNRGTVVDLQRSSSGRLLWVEVEADAPNSGTHTFQARELRRIR